MNKSRIQSSLFSALLLLFVLSGLTASAQLVTNQAALQKTSQQLAAEHAAFQKILLRTAQQKGWPLTLRNKQGRLAYLRGINSRGLPYYVITTDNIISAATIKTNSLWSGGATGANVNGSSGFLKGRIAVWDEGLVRPTHVELTGRVKQEDGNNSLSDHSTHVAGTMIAAGINPVAKGMAYGAQLLQTYDFDNDQSEMASAAGGTNGIIISNHSYADIAGWFLDASQNDRWEFWGNPGDTVDIRFGLYDQTTQVWDSIAYSAPYYLIAKAGGNNPGEQGPAVGQPYWRMNSSGTFVNSGNRPAGISNNAGYETIATYGNAKNILTLGAVNPIPGGYTKPSDVSIASFSSQGPTGDGRIKPDVVADGVNVLSSISTADNAYDIFSGTSMATPATAGSAFLLQEYFGKLHNDSLMYSATLRGLLIHTADEAGSAPGPDYVYGWGLVNMQKAANLITADHTDQSQLIRQSSLNNSTKNSETFIVTASGKMPVSATVCWTDPPGTPASIPVSSHNFQDTARKLVNDLDLRITDSATGKVYLPWTLDPKHPGNAAAKGDNIRDNVEKVELGDSLVPGRIYKVTVSHKGVLARSGTQAYSLLLSGVGGTTYCSSGATSTAGSAMTNVTIGNLNSNNPACPNNQGYVDSTGHVPVQLAIGQSTPISISYQNCSASTPANIAIYIDANSDNIFEGNELVLTQAVTSNTTSTIFNGSITVPATAQSGGLGRMRIIIEDGAIPAACGTFASGQTQDYTVLFTNPANDVGVSALEYPTSTTCASDSQLVSIHIRNYGSTAQAGGVPVTTVIRNGATVVKTLTAICQDSIPAGGDVVFTYNTTFQSQASTPYTFTSYTTLGGDSNTGNDSSTTSLTVNAAEGAGTGTATMCGSNATTVTLHANATEDDVALWYDSPTATAPIAAGNNTSTTDITANKTYYLGLNDLKVKGGAPARLSFSSTNPNLAGAYFRFGGNFIMFNTYVPLTIESAKMYIGHSGTITLTLATLASLNNNTGEYSYFPMYTNTIDVYATKPVPDTAHQINVKAGDNTDTGAVFLLNIPVPNPGSYILLIDCSNTTSAYLNANIPANANPYPLTVPGVFSITGNDFRDYGKADSVTSSHTFYYPFYNIGLRLEGCPASTRTPVTATTAASPVISLQGQYLVSSAATGNQWFLNDSLMTDSTTQQIQPRLPGVYYSVINDATTGCVLTSNSITYTPSTGDPNSRIGLSIDNPSNGVFKLGFYMSTADNTAITLTDMLGQKVYEQDLPGFSGQFTQTISAGYLASGMYVLRIIHGNDTYKKQIVIRH